MLGDIYYFLGLFVFIFSLNTIFNFFKIVEVQEWLSAYKKVIKKDPQKNEFRDPKDYNLFISYGCSSAFEIFWFIIGFCTSNWIIFLSLFLFDLFTKRFFYSSEYKISKLLGLITTILKSSIILLLVINHFHLHLNLLSFIV